ncbi:MAG TPA: FAD-dependent oxidoreductase [Gaiellaceae bacterium]|nr:FAD-dependent oxidoreductase [Gaiellaceae bacterium]
MNESRMHVAVAGAGVAGLETALALDAIAREYVAVELIAPEHEFTYRPLAVAEPFQVGEMRRFPLERLVDAAGADLRNGTLVGVEAEEKRATLGDGRSVAYDALVLALGAQPSATVTGALTFRGPEDRAALAELFERVTAGELRRLAFVVPPAASWPLPLYELSFLAAEYLAEHLTRGVELVLVTAEEQPLMLFGSQASCAITDLLEIRGIGLQTGAAARAWAEGTLSFEDGRELPADAVVALPTLEGPSLEGIPQDESGFVATDELGGVSGLTDVYAAGDLTQTPVKQGGLAAQQADTVAAAIAADAGAPVQPTPYEPVLRGLLLTGLAPRFLRSDDVSSVVDTQPLWWPPAKIVGRYLSPFLAEHLGLATTPARPPKDAVRIEVTLDTHDHATWSSV